MNTTNILFTALAAFTLLLTVLILTAPNPDKHCRAQTTLSYNACYLELTK